jgi:hypothetical protein
MIGLAQRPVLEKKPQKRKHQEDDPSDFKHKPDPNHHWGPYTLE